MSPHVANSARVLSIALNPPVPPELERSSNEPATVPQGNQNVDKAGAPSSRQLTLSRHSVRAQSYSNHQHGSGSRLAIWEAVTFEGRRSRHRVPDGANGVDDA